MNINLSIKQPGLPGMCPIADAVERLARDSDRSERGAIFTRREVVDFMLDLAGYTADRPLYQMRLLEPSFGGGEFLLAVASRLVTAAKAAGAVEDLVDCIRAVELHRNTYLDTRSKIIGFLEQSGFAPKESHRIVDAWLLHGDFLLSEIQGPFDFVVGNPPYVRQELIPVPLLAEYRRRYESLYDRADLYVPFIERSLSLLAKGGQFVFICANRWTKNRYGGPLRAIVARAFHLKAYVDMVDTPAFDSDVTAYPAITLIQRTEPGPTLVAKQPGLVPAELAKLARALRAGKACSELAISEIGQAGIGSQPWVLGSSEKRELLRRLEMRFPTLEEAGCKVGIGVATGADKAFIAPMTQLDVEPSRKVPLATTRDIASGEVRWLGLGVVNPFEDDGKLADLAKYPKLRAHLERHHDVIASRHVAHKAPANWYRTIDRITPSLAKRPKLLIPDIKGSAHVVYESGELYPHHNLYFVISDQWNLRALQAVLLSSVARQFVESYSTTMRGGFLRFQAQYLRRIRLPNWASVPEAMRTRLVQAAASLDLGECDRAACELFGLTAEEADILARESTT
ncbi:MULTISPECIES: TaqI-like C-terminal specificity domain-containing protein [unclassified Comamonas]|uniref:Eco57I restriction-modification methylase domain-containing protein n=1 Tax=unclassified Comamonas TaxID=2638500 RepID=UPI000ADC87FF|nr:MULTISPECIES: TaqI-like C-terminal specificity domain-containing protein [unclassified Comamonas]MBN9328902.1 Eco57I restriction-modification methylase domain-containing protein [Comamonas sp.]